MTNTREELSKSVEQYLTAFENETGSEFFVRERLNEYINRFPLDRFIRTSVRRYRNIKDRERGR